MKSCFATIAADAGGKIHLIVAVQFAHLLPRIHPLSVFVEELQMSTVFHFDERNSNGTQTAFPAAVC
jgi:hypothetical protein